MSPIVLFLMILIIGVSLLFVGVKVSGKFQLILLLLGAAMAIFGGFGVFTALI